MRLMCNLNATLGLGGEVKLVLGRLKSRSVRPVIAVVADFFMIDIITLNSRARPTSLREEKGRTSFPVRPAIIKVVFNNT